MSVTFAVGATSITIREPNRLGYEYHLSPRQQKDMAVGGSLQVADVGTIAEKRWLLKWGRLPTADKDALYAFVTSTCNWAETSFSYTDPWGTVFTGVRWWCDEWLFDPIAHEFWGGSLSLRQDVV